MRPIHSPTATAAIRFFYSYFSSISSSDPLGNWPRFRSIERTSVRNNWSDDRVLMGMSDSPKHLRAVCVHDASPYQTFLRPAQDFSPSRPFQPPDLPLFPTAPAHKQAMRRHDERILNSPWKHATSSQHQAPYRSIRPVPHRLLVDSLLFGIAGFPAIQSDALTSSIP